MIFSRKKFVLVVAIILLIFAYPVSLVMREVWELSDTFGIAIPSFIIGMAIGFLSCSLIMPGPEKKKIETDSNYDKIQNDSPEKSE